MKRILMLIAALGVLGACQPNPKDLNKALPKEGWKTYHDDVRNVTCFFYQHPEIYAVHFGAGCVPDAQWKK